MANNVSLIVIFLTLLLATRYLFRHIQIAIFKQKHGCQPEKRIPQKDPILGYDIFRIQVSAFKNNNVLGLAYERYQKYGLTWSVSLMGTRFYNTIETENIKTILATNFRDFGIGGRLEACRPLLGKGIFTTDGAEWEHSRSLIRPSFTKSQITNLTLFEPHILKLLSHMPKDGSTFDLQPLFFRLTLDTATEFLFGESVGSFDAPPGSEQDRFGKAFDLAQGKLRMRMGGMGMGRFWWDGEFERACRVVRGWGDGVVLRALENAKRPSPPSPSPSDTTSKPNPNSNSHSSPKEPSPSDTTSNPISNSNSHSSPKEPPNERYTILPTLLTTTQDPLTIRSQLLNLLLAGRDTTASFLSNTFHALLRHPRVFQKLKEEIDALGGRKPDYERLREMRYLKGVLWESLRLHPPIPSNARYALRDTILPLGGGPHGQSPLFIPKGGVVAYSLYSLHRREDIYGSDAGEFRPERWSEERLEDEGGRGRGREGGREGRGLRPGWAFLPFNGGPRVCVGMQFAVVEVAYTVVRLLQEVGGLVGGDCGLGVGGERGVEGEGGRRGFENRGGDGEWIPRVGLTACCEGGVRVGVIGG